MDLAGCQGKFLWNFSLLVHQVLKASPTPTALEKASQGKNGYNGMKRDTWNVGWT